MNRCEPKRPSRKSRNDVSQPADPANDNRPGPTEWDDGIMRLKEVLPVVGLSRSTIYRLKKEGKFPKPCPLTGRGAIGWYRSDIRTWLADRRRG